MNPAALKQSVDRLVAEYPQAQLERNGTGNLEVVDGNTSEPIGILDLFSGALTITSTTQDGEPA